MNLNLEPVFLLATLRFPRNWTAACALALVPCSIFFPSHLRAETKIEPKAVNNISDPIKTYKTFLDAIKERDLATAKKCCSTKSDDDTDMLDLFLRMILTFNRFGTLCDDRFQEARMLGANPFCPLECRNCALDRTKSRLDDSKVTYDRDNAKLTIKWEDEDAHRATFLRSKEDLTFRRIDGEWMLDFFYPRDDLLKSRSRESLLGYLDALNAACDQIESGSLTTFGGVVEMLRKRFDAMEGSESDRKRESNPSK